MDMWNKFYSFLHNLFDIYSFFYWRCKYVHRMRDTTFIHPCAGREFIKLNKTVVCHFANNNDNNLFTFIHSNDINLTAITTDETKKRKESERIQLADERDCLLLVCSRLPCFNRSRHMPLPNEQGKNVIDMCRNACQRDCFLFHVATSIYSRVITV